MKIVLQKSTGEILSAFSGIEPDDETLLGNHSNIDSSDLEIKTVTADEHSILRIEYLKKTADGYKELRRPEYPDIGDQLDDLYHKGAFSDEMAVKIKAVKDAHPKPE